MAHVRSRDIQLEELATALRSVDPRVVFVHPRILRRVVRGAHGLGRMARLGPIRGGFATRSQAALAIAQREELGFSLAESIPEFLIVLPEFTEEELENLSQEDAIVISWRQLFHARILLYYEENRDQFPDDGEWLTSRLDRLGRLEFAEIRDVLLEDHYLRLPADNRSTYIHFIARYLELRAFQPAALAHTFPAIDDHDRLYEMITGDLQPTLLLEVTRPPGAPASPVYLAELLDELQDPELIQSSQDDLRPPQPRRWARLVARAEHASEKGNHVRAAILRMQASEIAPMAEKRRTLSKAKGELDHLVRRLRKAIGIDAQEAACWRRALPTFLENASRGHWSREARLLYDLQKVVSDNERPIFAVNLAGWLTSLGRKPIKRLLPDQREVLLLNHLRAASRRLHSLRRADPALAQLETLIRHAIEIREHAIRERFRDRIGKVFDEASLRPRNLPEKAARRKLVEELLDLIAERGFLRIGDLRDAISSNQIKLNDLSGLGEFVAGDPLLRADALLARELDGVYQKGEVYLRTLQRASSVAFGTRMGRLLSRYLALPFGASFVVLEGLQHLAGPLIHWIMHIHVELMNPIMFLGLGLFLLGMINLPRFRSAMLRAASRLGNILWTVFFRLPRWILHRPLIREIVSTRSFYLLWNWIVKPIVPFLILDILVKTAGDFERLPIAYRAAVFAALAVIVNSRPGRNLEEIAADGASRLAHRLWSDIIPSILRGTLDFFAACLEAVEKMLYSVDEWLRYRGGEGRSTLAIKALLGLFWFVITYLVRIYINLLIEPQVNPVKHFPVVTVSHKIILPMSVTLIRIVRTPLFFLGSALATTIAASTVFLLPGVFGFLVWELKANWQLYAANRPKNLRPNAIGHHGETISRFLRRGFHSGTIPKLFAKLRRAEGSGIVDRHDAKSLKLIEALHHNQRAIHHFLERGVINLLEESHALAGRRLNACDVKFATNRLSFFLSDGDATAKAAILCFEEANQRLVARFEEPGWLADLNGDARQAMITALAGLYAMSDVDFASGPDSSSLTNMRTFPMAWDDWVGAWERDGAGHGHPPVVPDGCEVIPGPRITANSPRR